ncbi:MAG: hypothetical protein J7496_09080 [Novosphingobium sp.]|nr:hypothetical protein [Novosphingobium sp.]
MLELTRLRKGLVAEEKPGGDALAPYDGDDAFDDVFKIGQEVVCETEPRGSAEPDGASAEELVINATGGFVGLWEQGTVLNWRFNPQALRRWQFPQQITARVEMLFATAVKVWGDAAPVKFSYDDEAWDFEIKPLVADKQVAGGFVLAEAFFPGGGQQELRIYPKMFDPALDPAKTLAHEIGHIFGLRHWFALLKEQAAPAVSFGTIDDPHSIMNYGDNCRITDLDKSDLKTLYELVWSGRLKEINGTPIRLVQPYHLLGRLVGVAA